jgi:hypothetical protein
LQAEDESRLITWFTLYHFPARRILTGKIDSASINIFYLLLLLMPMPVMNIGHMIVLMFFGGMFVLVGMDSLYIVMSMRRVIVAVTVLMK